MIDQQRVKLPINNKVIRSSLSCQPFARCPFTQKNTNIFELLNSIGNGKSRYILLKVLRARPPKDREDWIKRARIDNHSIARLSNSIKLAKREVAEQRNSEDDENHWEKPKAAVTAQNRDQNHYATRKQQLRNADRRQEKDLIRQKEDNLPSKRHTPPRQQINHVQIQKECERVGITDGSAEAIQP